MVIEGWNHDSSQQQGIYSNEIPIRNQQNRENKMAQESEIFYSIKECSPKD
jgi:hypothetical protein